MWNDGRMRSQTCENRLDNDSIQLNGKVARAEAPLNDSVEAFVAMFDEI